MNELVSSIFYFGSPKDGFKVYPNVGAVFNVFSGYYSNTETDWILVAKKSDELTRYTYVKYGLLTSAVDGRTGSCFGISIDFLNHYFTDLNVFRTQIVEGIWGALLDDKQLLEIQETSGKVAFKSYDFYDVGPYLDGMSKRIREVIADNKYSSYIRPFYEIPDGGDNPVYGLHPDSSPAALNEYFRNYGVIKLSPKLPIETKSFSEKQEERTQNLQEEINRLNALLKQRDDETKRLHQRLEKLGGLVRPLFTEFSSGDLPSPSNLQLSEQTPNLSYEPYHPLPKQSYYPPPKDPSRQHLKGRTIIFIVAGVVLTILLAMGLYFSSDEDVGSFPNATSNDSTRLPRVTPAPNDPLLIKIDNGKRKAFLNESAFLKDSEGTTVSNESDFRMALTSYLLKSSPEAQSIYKGNDDELWNTIMELNPSSRRSITEYIKRRAPFKIENSGDQQNILKDLVIFIQSSPL